MIFVCGISAVGKTTAIDRFVVRYPGYVHLRASSILRGYDRPIKNITIEQAKENQRVLRQELLTTCSASRTLVDGHMTLPIDNKLFKVPLSFFYGLDIRGFLLLWADPQVLLRRKGYVMNAEGIRAVEASQRYEMEHMKYVAEYYRCKMEAINSDDEHAIEVALLNMTTS